MSWELGLQETIQTGDNLGLYTIVCVIKQFIIMNLKTICFIFLLGGLTILKILKHDVLVTTYHLFHVQMINDG